MEECWLRGWGGKPVCWDMDVLLAVCALSVAGALGLAIGGDG